MSNAGPVSGSAAYVCYRIDITGTQPAGYYYNKIKYTAVPTFWKKVNQKLIVKN